MDKFLNANETYAIRGAAFEVYKQMGSGFLESVYHECLVKELSIRRVPYISQVGIPLEYKGMPLHQMYRADIICYESIILELKAVKAIASEHRAQILNYLKATNMKLGLLINFGSSPRIEIERFIQN